LAYTGLASLDNLLGSEGYPDRSAILIVGPPGIGKEALGYWFTQVGLAQNDFCLYNTRLSSKEVLQDPKAFSLDFSQRVPFWLSSSGGQLKFDVNDLAGFSYNVKDVLKKNGDRKIRITSDVLSSLLMLNPADMIYKFLTQLFADVKNYDSVLLATLEEGMHPPNVLAAMQQFLTE
jgi:KaiC/GvpD/RAD55 family RecA-like ATPase